MEQELKSKFKLIIKRSAKFTGSAMRTNVLVNGTEKAKLWHKDEVEFILPRGITKIKLYNNVPLGRNIMKEFVVDPLKNKTIEIAFYYKMNWMAMIPPFSFLIPTSSIETEIRYIEE